MGLTVMGLTVQGPFVVECPYHVAHSLRAEYPVIAPFSPKSQVNGERYLK